MQSSIAAAETLGHNEDLLEQLLIRVPAKSLLRFKCVSKLWLSLISCPKFCNSHTLRNRNPKFSSACLLINRAAKREPQFTYSNLPNPQGLKIIQSCNGLLLCTSSIDIIRKFSKFYVVNPTTCRLSEIALPPPSLNFPFPLSVALAFDPSKSRHYKLVCVSGANFFSALGDPIEIEVYSSETRTWRACDSTNMWFPSAQFLPGVYYNGRINWFGMFCWLVHYDIDEGHFGFIEVVNEFGGYDASVDCILGESGGHLHLLRMYQSLNQLDVVEMRNDYTELFVKYRVDLNPMRAAIPCTCSTCTRICPFLFRDGEENEEQNPVLLLHNGYEVISFNIRDKSFEILCTLITPSRVGWTYAYQYMESLAGV